MHAITAIAQQVAAIEATIGSAGTLNARSVGTAASGSSVRFDQVLSSVVEGSTGAARTRTTDGVPRDLAAYGNGKIPRTALQEVGTTGHRLWAPAGQALEGLLAEAARDGGVGRDPVRAGLHGSQVVGGEAVVDGEDAGRGGDPPRDEAEEGRAGGVVRGADDQQRAGGDRAGERAERPLLAEQRGDGLLEAQ